jgi:hypothetical protein
MENLRSFTRLAAGPLALLAFFLPWTHGVGILRYESYSGFDLVRLATILGQLDLAPSQGIALFAAKCLLLAVPVAAVWRTLLSPVHSWHWGYRVAGVYLAIAGVGLGAAGVVSSGGVLPSPGLGLLSCASLMILVPNVRLSLHSLAQRFPRTGALSNRQMAKALGPKVHGSGPIST